MRRLSGWVAFLLAALILWGAPTRAQEDGEQEQPPRLTAEEAARQLQTGKVILLDVRPADEIAEQGTLPGYRNIPIDELEDRWQELPRDRPVLTA